MNLDDMYDVLRKRASAIYRRDELRTQLKTSEKNTERLVGEIDTIDAELAKYEASVKKLSEVK